MKRSTAPPKLQAAMSRHRALPPASLSGLYTLVDSDHSTTPSAMGNDGGSIARRDDLVKVRAATGGAADEDPSSARQRWAVCGLSKLPLQEPVVADDIGGWFNMESLVSLLLKRKQGVVDGALQDDPKEDPIPHVCSLKDVTKLALQRNPDFKSKLSSDMAEDEKPLPFICPLSAKVFSGAQRCVFLNTCGCTFAESALRTVVAPDNSPFPASRSVACPECSKDFRPPPSWFRQGGKEAEAFKAESDVVPLHPPAKERFERLEALYARRKEGNDRRNAKRKHRAEGGAHNKHSKRKHVL